jgi:iron(III) transport system substrate-binding protein
MRLALTALAAALLLAGCGEQAPPADAADAADAGPTLVVYTARNEQLVRPLFERYTAETGVRIEYMTDKEAPLMERLAAEGATSPADVLITVDAGNLWQAAERGLLRPLESPVLEGAIPAHLRDPEGRWFGLSVRARTLVYNIDRLPVEDAPATYAELATPEWRGRLCLRSASKVYNQSLVAMTIAAEGEAAADAMVRGWVANLAAPPFASDDEVIQAVAAGRCDVGIVNTYYFGRLKRDNPGLPVALAWPDQGEGQRGVHVNVSGAGVTTHAPHPAEAQAFIEWLSLSTAQMMFAAENLEYPANPNIPMVSEVRAWGEFRADTGDITRAGALQADAVRLMDAAGYR